MLQHVLVLHLPLLLMCTANQWHLLKISAFISPRLWRNLLISPFSFELVLPRWLFVILRSCHSPRSTQMLSSSSYAKSIGNTVHFMTYVNLRAGKQTSAAAVTVPCVWSFKAKTFDIDSVKGHKISNREVQRRQTISHNHNKGHGLVLRYGNTSISYILVILDTIFLAAHWSQLKWIVFLFILLRLLLNVGVFWWVWPWESFGEMIIQPGASKWLGLTRG